MSMDERMRDALLGIAGCTNCKVCQEVALRLVGSPWQPKEDRD